MIYRADVADAVVCGRGGTSLTVRGQDLDIAVSPVLHVTTTVSTGENRWNVETTRYQAVRTYM